MTRWPGTCIHGDGVPCVSMQGKDGVLCSRAKRTLNVRTMAAVVLSGGIGNCCGSKA